MSTMLVKQYLELRFWESLQILLSIRWWKPRLSTIWLTSSREKGQSSPSEHCSNDSRPSLVTGRRHVLQTAADSEPADRRLSSFVSFLFSHLPSHCSKKCEELNLGKELAMWKESHTDNDKGCYISYEEGGSVAYPYVVNDDSHLEHLSILVAEVKEFHQYNDKIILTVLLHV